jgi:hypothetical protein
VHAKIQASIFYVKFQDLIRNTDQLCSNLNSVKYISVHCG